MALSGRSKVLVVRGTFYHRANKERDVERKSSKKVGYQIRVMP
jgi:hypothetical protein